MSVDFNYIFFENKNNFKGILETDFYYIGVTILVLKIAKNMKNFG